MIKADISINDLLFRKLAAGDRLAMGQLYEIYKEAVYRKCVFFTKDHETASDLVQDCFLKLWEERERLQYVEAPANYFQVLCRNLILKFLSRKKNQQLIITNIGALQQKSVDPYQQMANKENQQQLTICIEKLTPQRKIVTYLKRHQELSNQEIAHCLGLTTETVKSHYGNALNDLKKSFGLQ